MSEISPFVSGFAASADNAVDPTRLAKRAEAAANDSVKDRKVREMWKAAEGFEAIFLHSMLKAMRETTMGMVDSEEEPGLSDNSDTMKLVRGLHDQEMAESLSKSHRFGLSKMIFDWMARGKPELKNASAPVVSALHSYQAVKTLGSDAETAIFADKK